jgi:hypothetical protein
VVGHRVGHVVVGGGHGSHVRVVHGRVVHVCRVVRRQLEPI